MQNWNAALYTTVWVPSSVGAGNWISVLGTVVTLKELKKATVFSQREFGRAATYTAPMSMRAVPAEIAPIMVSAVVRLRGFLVDWVFNLFSFLVAIVA